MGGPDSAERRWTSDFKISLSLNPKLREESLGHRLGMCLELCFAFLLRFFFLHLLFAFFLCCIFFAFAVCIFFVFAGLLEFCFALFCVAGVLELCFAFFLHFFGLKRPRPGKMRKGGTSKPQGRPKCKKHASLEAAAGQNAKKMQAWKQTQKMKKKMQKFAGIAEITENLKNWPFPGAFAFFCMFFCICLLFFACFAFFLPFFVSVSRLAFFFCIFFAFWPAAASRLAFFFAFWSSLGFRCASFSHFAGSRPLQPKKMQKKCKAQFKQASKHKKNAKQNSSRPANTKNNANSKCKKNATQKKCKQQMQKNANYIVCIGVDNVLGWTRRSPLRFF